MFSEEIMNKPINSESRTPNSEHKDILLVEDDTELGEGIQTFLEIKGFTLDWVKDGVMAMEKIQRTSYELILLDLGLPQLSGLKVLQQMRLNGNQQPVLILSARDTIDDKIKGLNSGADDYIPKPFDLDELYARVHRSITRHAIVRRMVGDNVVYRNMKLDLNAMLVHMNDQTFAMPRREFTLLKKLIENAGKVMSRDQLQQCLYGWSDEIDSNTIEVHIHNLRKKFGNQTIRTIRGIGYMMDKE